MFFFFQAEDGIRDGRVTGVQTCALPIWIPVEEENPYWQDPEFRARFFDWDPETGWYRRFFDVGDLGGGRVEDPEKIGRASCRGRGENLGGGGSFKKKKRGREGER